MRVAAPQIYVGAEGWLSHFLHGKRRRWHCVCFKSSRQMRVKDVWTAQPSHSSRHRPFLSHPAISLCITMICHASSFGLVSQCVFVLVCVCALSWIWNHNSVTVHMHVLVVKWLKLPDLLIWEITFTTWMVTLFSRLRRGMNTKLEMYQASYMWIFNFLLNVWWK